jgi:hypothetical protein
VYVLYRNELPYRRKIYYYYQSRFWFASGVLRYVPLTPTLITQYPMDTDSTQDTQDKLEVARQKKAAGDAGFKAGNISDGV